MATTEANLDRIDRVWYEAIENGELAAVDELLADDYVGSTPGAADVLRGPDGFKGYVQTFREAFPDLSVSIEDRIVGDEAVVDRYRLSGTHEGEFKGIAPTGTEIDVTGTVIHYLEGNQVVKDVSEFDTLDLMKQLGVVELPDM